MIANGRIGEYPDVRYTCHTAIGQSIVNYVIIDVELLINVTSFSMNLENPLSDHNSITTCPVNVQEDVRTFYRWYTNDGEEYTTRINSDKLQTQITPLIEDIHVKSAPQQNDIDHVVCDVKHVSWKRLGQIK